MKLVSEESAAQRDSCGATAGWSLCCYRSSPLNRAVLLLLRPWSCPTLLLLPRPLGAGKQGGWQSCRCMLTPGLG